MALKSTVGAHVIYVPVVLVAVVLSVVAFIYITAPVGLPGDNVVIEATWIKTEGQYELTANYGSGDNLRTADGAVIEVVGLDVTEDSWYLSGIYKERIYGKILSGNVRAGASIEVYRFIPESSTPTIVVTSVKADLNEYIASTTTNGVELTKLLSPTPDTLLSVYMVSPDKAWAGGNFGVYMWNGTGWFADPRSPLYATESIFMLSENMGWRVGSNAVVLKWNGSCWSEMNSATPSYLSSIYMLSENDGWAVGLARIVDYDNQTVENKGLVMRWDGSSWAEVSSPTTNELYSVHMLSPQNGWAVGENGTILMWDGSSWSEISSPTNNDLQSVYMLSENEGWAVGSLGTILKWDGNNWATFQSPTQSWLSSVYMLSENEGWAVGSGGTILNWDGSTWSEVQSPTEKSLYDIHMLTSTEGWAVGSEGTIVQFSSV